MQIYLKMASNQNLGKITNYTYKENQSIKIKLFPFPTWLKNPKCETCNEPAHYLLENMSPICRNCLNKIFKEVVTLEKNDDVNIPLDINSIKKLRFEWSIDGERWYPINGQNIKFVNMEKFLEAFKNSIINDKVLKCEADYSKETKEMKIFNIIQL
jgi:hypothetical protein